MASTVIIALDVGGTQVKAAAVIGGEIASHTIGYHDSRADRPVGPLIEHLVSIFAETLAKAGPDAVADGLGLAFPGPFDYAQGVSLIRGLGKFDGLYGLPVGELLRRGLAGDERTRYRLAPHFRILFENDAALFGLGESLPGGAAERAGRAVGLTIGTGLGSCFLENGRLIKHRSDVPDEGWLYKTPHEEGIADDYVSRKGMLSLADALGLDSSIDVRGLAGLADAGDEKARKSFEEFGRRAFVVLGPALLEFGPHIVVFGGQISKSAHLFLPAFAAEASRAGLNAQLRISADTLRAALRGIDVLLRGSLFE
ncbi:ROK family protein [Saccharibacillus endophyticus]|uniref:ROK family protein n=1 Tax=Saccharibacillus endophyticus TaxID=2060666 RepID=A0ABQ1ZMA3_9BACL|nr:ROK family protein [Saccharibacillus endophyticus]GGH68712.1 hypothetical protein GCM10007362_03010 [Saccharibacillus endophyticus]